MRLIDADALRESVLKWLPHDPCGVEENEHPYETDICVSMLMEIEDAPTIEPEKRTEERTETHACDLIDRQAMMKEFADFVRKSNYSAQTPTWNDAVSLVGSMPSAQPERDIPKKPTATIDHTWGIANKQPTCPKCGYYLGYWRFLDFGGADGECIGKRITYCEHCGQAIDWEGWDEDG